MSTVVVQSTDTTNITQHAEPVVVHTSSQPTYIQNTVELPITIISDEHADTIVSEKSVSEVVSHGSRGPVGPQGPAGAGGVSFSMEAGEDLIVGTPITNSTGTLVKANSINKHNLLGFCSTDTLTGFSATVVVGGAIHRTDWTGVAGTVSLTPASPYYLSTVPGMITTVPPSSGFLIRLGIAASSDVLLANIQEPIYLN